MSSVINPQLRSTGLRLAAAVAVCVLGTAAVADDVSYTYDELGRLKTVTREIGQDTTVATYHYDPAGNRTLADVADSPHFGIADGIGLESTQVGLDVTLYGPVTATHSVSYSTSLVTASGSDLTTVSGTLNFSNSAETQTILVPTTNDSTFEGDETFKITLSSPTGGATITDNEGIGTISDESDAPTFSVNDVSAVESLDHQFQVSMSGATLFSHNVSYSTTNGTATAGSDYTSTSGSLTFSNGGAPQTVTVSITDDSVFETDETLVLNLDTPTNGAAIGDGSGQGTIENNDNGPPNAENDWVEIVGKFQTAWVYVLNNDSDPNNDPLTITSVTQPTNAIVTIHTNPQRLKVFSKKIGESSFNYTISDGNGGTDTASVSVDVVL